MEELVITKLPSDVEGIWFWNHWTDIPVSKHAQTIPPPSELPRQAQFLGSEESEDVVPFL